MFLIHVNDFPNGLKRKYKLFADDTCLYSVAHEVNTSANDVNIELNNAQKIKFSIKDFFRSFTEESLNQKLHILRSES